MRIINAFQLKPSGRFTCIKSKETNMRVCFDLEATGLSRYKSFIIQIGAVATTDNGEKHTFEEFVRPPNGHIPPKITEITGIKEEDVADARDAKDVLTAFFKWITDCKHKSKETSVVLCAYNGCGYDYDLLFSEMARNDLNPMSVLVDSGVEFLLDPLLFARGGGVDTLMLKRRSCGRPCFKLTSVHSSLLGEEFDQAHTALADSEALNAVCNHDAFSGMCETKSSAYCKTVQSYCDAFNKIRADIDRCTLKTVDSLITKWIQNKSSRNGSKTSKQGKNKRKRDEPETREWKARKRV